MFIFIICNICTVYRNRHRSDCPMLGHARFLPYVLHFVIFHILLYFLHVPVFFQLREMPVNSKEHPWQMTQAEINSRKDLRDTHLVFSIDPLGCEDVDDTLSVRTLPGGKRLELGVHIADVTHFVKEGSLTDLEARSR